MAGLWSFIGDTDNRARLTWIGAGIAAVVAALWTAFVYSHPAKSEGEGARISADCGSVAIGGSVTGGTINAGAPANCGGKPK
jgi:hypothetical protein